MPIVCQLYSEMALKDSEHTGFRCFERGRIFGGTLAKPMEFPHMVIERSKLITTEKY